MRIHFSGADRTVTGSCHAVEINGLRLLLDFGMYQGRRDDAIRINAQLPEDLAHIDAIVLSHGHLDHCGRLPMALKRGFKGPIYCTPATAAVARIVLVDSAKIQEENAGYLNQRSRGPREVQVRPLYTSIDVEPIVKRFKHVEYETPTDLGRGVTLSFHDAGHILGSAYVILRWTEAGKPRSLLFTGDVGRYGAPILRDPSPIPFVVDDVITESTYGNTSHGPIDAVEPQLLEAIQYCIARKSRLLVPSFAVGRTQTILWYVQKFVAEKKIEPICLVVDSPMGVEMSRVTDQFPELFDAKTKAQMGKGGLYGSTPVQFASSMDESKRINTQDGPCVIIASSPTCEFGRILHHLTISLERPNDMVLFVGWVPPETLGRRLQDGDKRVRVLDRYYDVRCGVKTIHGLSAHADGDELLRFLKPTTGPGTTAYVVHGEVPQAEGFAARLTAVGMGRVIVPATDTSMVSGLQRVKPSGDVGRSGDTTE
jgi:metallo-beta-lactamase family protein